MGTEDFLKLVILFVNIFYAVIGASHTNNWAVLVDTSRFWFNYRHEGNVLAIYQSIKRLGIPDSHIILMVADDMACDARNPRPGSVSTSAYNPVNMYGEDVEVDYRGYEVTVENFIRVLTGRLHPATPPSKRLLSDERSNIFLYMTGHGGDGFIKFQDAEEISSKELADAFEQMWQKRRYGELLFIADTCQAESLSSRVYSPNILAIGSSRVGEDSLSHHRDPQIGVFVADRYSYYAFEYLNSITPDSKSTLADFLRICPPEQCVSHVAIRADLYQRDPRKVLATEFFGSVRRVELFNGQMKFDLNMTKKFDEKSTIAKLPNQYKLSYQTQFPFPVET